MNNETQANNHPDWNNIVGFIDDPGATEFKDIELHLASCVDCRTKASELAQLQLELSSADFIQQQTLIDIVQSKSNNLTTLSEQEIEDYVDGNDDEQQQQHVKTLLHEEPTALKAALHYASHQSAMMRELPELENMLSVSKSINTPQVNKVSITSLIKRFLTQPIPAWIMLPASGFASVLLFLILNSQFQTNDSGVKIASYQDNAVLQFSTKNQQPGIGFFSNARKKTIAFENVVVSINDKAALHIHWPAINAALSYTIIIKKIDFNQTVVIAEQTVSTNNVIFDDIPLFNNRRYQWVLTGDTSDSESFYASGGFVSPIIDK